MGKNLPNCTEQGSLYPESLDKYAQSIPEHETLVSAVRGPQTRTPDMRGDEEDDRTLSTGGGVDQSGHTRREGTQRNRLSY